MKTKISEDVNKQIIPDSWDIDNSDTLREMTLDELDSLYMDLTEPRYRELRERVGEVVFEKVEKQVEERRIRNGYYNRRRN